MSPEAEAAVAAALGDRPLRATALSGGCIAEIYRVDLAGGGRVVVKQSDKGGLDVEAFMLRYLAANSDLPVPGVIHAVDGLLIMDYVETGGGLDARAQIHAAELLAALHAITADGFGFERDTLIGPLVQPNPWRESWIDFFGEQRLLHFGRLACDGGNLPVPTLRGLEALVPRLEDIVGPPGPPSLVHGDMWGGNVLVRDGRIAAFVDPAIHFADAEVELAFATLFNTFGDPFFGRYGEIRPLRPGFFEVRRDLYNLYPLLVHTALFGGHYAGSVARTVSRFV